jgi:hypothetical protein
MKNWIVSYKGRSVKVSVINGHRALSAGAKMLGVKINKVSAKQV